MNDVPIKVKVGKCKTDKPYIYYLRTPEDYNYDKYDLPEYVNLDTTRNSIQEILKPIGELKQKWKSEEIDEHLCLDHDKACSYIIESEQAIKETLDLARKAGVEI